MSGAVNTGKYSLALLVLILAAGALLRFHGLDENTYTHPEFYVPGIEIPAYITHPISRTTVADVLVTPFVVHHPHLPAHDLLMLGWTTLFGLDTAVIRASSALAGTLLILVTFLFARDVYGRKEALLAAAIVALHGHQVYWSQFAKQWVLLGLLGMLSSWLLLRLSRTWSYPVAASYLLACVVGLWVDSYFWPVFAAQILWVWAGDSNNARPSSRLQIQMIALMLAVCTLPYLIYFSTLPSHLPEALWPRIVEMLQFGGLFLSASAVQPPPVIGIAVAIVGLILMFQGLRTAAVAQAPVDDRQQGRDAIMMAWMVAALVVAFALGALIFNNENVLTYTRTFYASLVAPVVLLLAWLLVRWRWKWFRYPLVLLTKIRALADFSASLPAVMMLVPFLLLVAIHLRKPVLVDFALVSLAPFFIVIASRGVFRLRGFLQPVVITGVVLACAFSVYQSRNVPNPRDYKALADVLQPEVMQGDVLLIDNKWYVAPMLYYFPPSRYPSRPSGALGESVIADAASRDNTEHTRFWLIDFIHGEEDEKRFAARKARLPGMFAQVKALYAGKGVALLLESQHPVPILLDAAGYTQVANKPLGEAD